MVDNPMIDNPRYLSVGRLFAERNIFIIPKYQRNYAWEESQIDDFWEDIKVCYEARTNNSNKEHFFGGIVFISKQMSGTDWNRCDLIDGQQRISTFVILSACIKELYQDLILTENEDVLNALLNKRISKLNEKYFEYEIEVNRRYVTKEKILLSEPDRQFFKDKINGIEPTIERESHKRLTYAFTTLKSKLKNILDTFSTLDDKMDCLSTIENIVDEDCSVIIIPTKSETDAYRIFQVLNDRGISLSEGDLLRAKTLELLEDCPTYQITAEKEWDDILSDPTNKTSDFLKRYYASITGTRPSTTSLLEDFSNKFFPFQSQQMDEIKAQSIVQQVIKLKQAVTKCRLISEGDWPFQNSTVTTWDRDRLRLLIVELKHTYCIPLLLAASELSESKFSQVVQMIERSFFRYKVICNQHINSLNTLYLKHSKEIRQNPEVYNVNDLKSEFNSLLERKSNDQTFKNRLDELMYQTSAGNKNLKYFLITLEYYSDWYYDGANGLPQCRNKNLVYDFNNTTIEHIHSQSPGNSVPSLEPTTHKLGNLTILGSQANERLENKPFMYLSIENSSIFYLKFPLEE